MIQPSDLNPEVLNSEVLNPKIINPKEPCSENWHGMLNLTYASRQGKTVIVEQKNQAPLKVQRPLYPEAQTHAEGQKICHSIILHTAGGVVGGDRLSCNFDLQPNSQALITTAAASKIYRSNGIQARQKIEINIDERACLEWLPQETIVFNAADYHQDLRVNLASNASFLGWEINRFGRTARGEKFVQGNWRSHTEIYQEGIPLWIDRQWLPGSEEIFHSPNGLAGQAVIGSLIFVGKTISKDIVEQVRSLWKSNPQSLIPNPKSPNQGVTRLNNGFLCRYRGNSTAEVRNWFISVWLLLRTSFLSRGSSVPRVWLL